MCKLWRGALFNNKFYLHGFLYLLLLAPVLCVAQKKIEIDSLNNLLKNTNVNSTHYIDILNTLGSKYANTDSAKASTYAMQAKNLSDKAKYSEGNADALRTIGILQT